METRELTDQPVVNLSTSRRGFLKTGGALATVAASGLPRAVAAQQDSSGGHLVIAQGAFPPSLSPTESGNPTLSLLLQFMDGLTRTTGDLEVVPHLATEWEPVTDTSWQFKLREDVSFHNGEPFNAEVVKFSIERALDPQRGYGRRGRIGLVTEVEVVDDYTVILHTSAPFPLLPRGLRDIVMEPPAYVSEDEEAAVMMPIGTGPFKVSEWIPGDRIELIANDDYFNGRPPLDAVTIRNIAEPSTRLSALLANEIHIAEQLPIDLLPEIEASSDHDVYSVPVAMGLVITYDLLTEGPVNDIRVRQAIDCAIDREALFNGLLLGQGAILDGQLVTTNSVGYNPNLSATTFDQEKSMALLAEAGFADGLELDLYTPEGKYLLDRDMAIAVASQLEQVGIKINLQVLEWGDYSERNANKELSPMYIIGWYNVGDSEFALVWYSTDSGRSYWENPEFDELFNRAQTTVDPVERQALFEQANQMMSEELPSSFLFQLPALFGTSKAVANWEPRQDEMLYLAETQISN